MMWRSFLVGLAGTIIAFVLWILNCSGPKPELADVRVKPPAGEGQPYQVEATVQNAGLGHGQINVVARLRDKSSGQTYQEGKLVQLEEHEVTRVTAEIQAPPGSYEPEVELEYPPR